MLLSPSSKSILMRESWTEKKCFVVVLFNLVFIALKCPQMLSLCIKIPQCFKTDATHQECIQFNKYDTSKITPLPYAIQDQTISSTSDLSINQ